jgi:hypothetical protein
MATSQIPGTPIEERLERGEVVWYPSCPFPVPQGDDHRFLLEQQLGNRVHKNISYDPHTHRSTGFGYQSEAQAQRLHELLAEFSRTATAWLSGTLPHYAAGWRLDKVSYRPEEEATRKLRQTARNDLLHVDAFPSRPTNGHRILRLFVNINPSDVRVWVTSDPFAKLLSRYGREVGLPSSAGLGLWRRVRQGMLRLAHPKRPTRSPYDEFMLRFHDFLKANDEFQDNCPKTYWKFAPGSAWMVFTDTASHAVLRGRYALEHSYFVAPDVLALPEESPAALLEMACGEQVLLRAA